MPNDQEKIKAAFRDYKAFQDGDKTKLSSAYNKLHEVTALKPYVSKMWATRFVKDSDQYAILPASALIFFMLYLTFESQRKAIDPRLPSLSAAFVLMMLVALVMYTATKDKNHNVNSVANYCFEKMVKSEFDGTQTDAEKKLDTDFHM